MSIELSGTTNRQPQEDSLPSPLPYSATYQYIETVHELNDERKELIQKPRISIFNSSYLSTENLLELMNTPLRRRHRLRKNAWMFPVLLLLFTVLLLLALSSPMTTLSPYNPYNSDTFEYPIYPLLEGTKMHLSSVAVGGKYVRVDPTSSSQQMALSENIPWKHGSTNSYLTSL